jgi:hypothetical protein
LKNIYQLFNALKIAIDDAAETGVESSKTGVEGSEQTVPKPWTARLSEQLSVEPHDEDWGLWNGDPVRLEEFLDFYDSHVPTDLGELEDLGALILQSTEEALDEEDSISRELLIRVALFVQANHLFFPEAIESYAGPFALDGEIETLVQHALLDHYGQRPL